MSAFAPAAQEKRLHPDAMALRDYILAGDKTRYDLLPQGVVMIGVTHSNLTMAMPDIRLDLHTTIDGVKDKLYTHCGTKPQHQRLILKDSSGNSLARLDDDSKKLGYYSVESGMCIHIIDEDPFSLSKNGGLEDVSKVQKYRMSEEDYDTRKGTLREWIKKEKAKNTDWKAPWNKAKDGPEDASGAPQPAAAVGPPPGPESIEGMSVGQRCECMPGSRRGTIMFLGEAETVGEGYWVGVKLDEPLGRSDGSAKGVVYFECLPKYGAFIRPKNVTVGDFPERDLDDEEEDEDEDEI